MRVERGHRTGTHTCIITATVDVLKSVHRLAKFDNLAERPFVLFLEPPSLDPRITNQFALFSLMPGAAGAWTAGSPSLRTSRGASSSRRLKGKCATSRIG
jgi:hypothetical protein